MNYQVDDLALDVGQRRVSRDDQQLDVSGLTFDLFLAIVQAAPNIIGADELVEKVWSGRPTSPETITQRAMMLRQALGDSADAPRYIEVVRGQGFRLIPALKGAQPTKIISTSRTGLAIAAAAATAAAIVAIAFVWNGGAPPANVTASDSNSAQAIAVSATGLQRFAIPVEIEAGLGGTNMSAELALSSDGSRLAYTKYDREKETSVLFVRGLDQFDAHELRGTENARRPVFSPDGNWIAYSGPSDIGLQKISVTGGSPQKLADIRGRNFGNSWGDDGYIVYSTSGSNANLDSHLERVPDTGGEPEILIPESGGIAFIWPESLPGGRHVLFTLHDVSLPAVSGDIGILSLDTMEYEILIKNAYRPTYLPSGHLVFGRGSELWAVRFDALEAEVLGGAVPMVSGIELNSQRGDLAYAASGNGLLSFIRGEDISTSAQQHLYWVGKNSASTPLGVSGQSLRNPRLSPDDSKLAVSIFDVHNDVWTVDIDRKHLVRVTNSPSAELFPVWSPDGEELNYFMGGAEAGIYVVRADGSGEHRQALMFGESGDDDLPMVADEAMDISLVELGTEEFKVIGVVSEDQVREEAFLRSEFTNGRAILSPNRRWLAYESNETGRAEIYVRPYPDVDSGKSPISVEGGSEPMWSDDGTRLFFRTTNRIWEVDVQTDDEFVVGSPVVVATGDFVSQGWGTSYDVTADGERFLVILALAPEDDLRDQASFAFVTNWAAELERALPTSK